MKKLLLYTTLMAGVLSGCDLDINDDPDYPMNDQVTADLIFPAAQTLTASHIGGQIYNYAGFFAQYFEQRPEASQYDNLATYSFKEADDIMDYAYSNLTAGALKDLKEVLDKSENPADRFAATVLRTYIFQVLVDNFDRCPYTEALLGEEALNPKWDEGSSVYVGVLDEMDAAEAELTATSAMDSDDLMLDGDMDQWRGFANALRLRMYLRLIQGGVDASGYEAKVKDLVQNGTFFTGDIDFDAYSNESNKRNPWYETNAMGLTGNHCVAYPLISYLEATGDPRISYGISKAEATQTYVGQIPGGKTETRRVLGNANLWMNKHVSGIDYTVGATKPVCFFTQAELQFLKAEVFLKYLNNDAAAETAFNAGIDADFAVRGVKRNSTFNNNVMWNGTTDEKLRLIYMQKWVALFYMDHMEAWSEARRTDCPSFSDQTAAYIFEHREDNASLYNAGDFIYPWTNDLGDRRAVKRIFYPLDAVLYNPNAPESPELDTPVWWDK